MGAGSVHRRRVDALDRLARWDAGVEARVPVHDVVPGVEEERGIDGTRTFGAPVSVHSVRQPSPSSRSTANSTAPADQTKRYLAQPFDDRKRLAVHDSGATSTRA